MCCTYIIPETLGRYHCLSPSDRTRCYDQQVTVLNIVHRPDMAIELSPFGQNLSGEILFVKIIEHVAVNVKRNQHGDFES